ncbi:O-antigen ligase family protein [Brevundimonas sp.]|uniref:O-antigen ligase family protein n=1 Tax=Brevundimonas sp. TaxID=1871086 RepID=UPI003AF8E5E0
MALLAAFVVPFTALRFGVVGLGEILVLTSLIFILNLNRGSLQISDPVFPLVQFWVAYIIVIVFGFAFNLFVLGYNSGTLSGAAFDISSYLIILAAVLLLGDERIYHGDSPHVFFRELFSLWAIAYSLLYIISLFTPQVLGFPLKYYNNFSPLVENVHQAAMVTAAMPFIMWHLASMGRVAFRLFCVISGGLFMIMALQSGSTKALVAVFVGSVVSASLLAFGVLMRRSSVLLRVAAIICVGVLGASLLVANADYIYPMAVQFFQNNDGSSAREGLYTIGFNHALDSIIFGYGPGPHISYDLGGEFSDAHNTALTIILQGGILAIVISIVAAMAVIRRTASSAFLVGALSSISMYLIGGDILRRLPIWIIVVGVLYLSRECRNTARLANGIRSIGGPVRNGIGRR